MKCNTVLIIEDDNSIREVLSSALELEGYSVRTASNGQEGLRILPTLQRPCLILLDLMMPVMDGWAFAEAIHKDVILAAIPIVIVTAFADRSKSVPGARGIIKKPVDLDDLIKVVRRHCG